MTTPSRIARMRRAHGTSIVCALTVLVAAACGGSATDADPPAGPAPDLTSPHVSGLIYSRVETTDTSLGAAAFRLGDTIRFVLHGGDDRKLAWLGFSTTGAITYRDSLSVPDSIATEPLLQVTVSVTAPTTGVLNINVFARDSSGNLTEARLSGSPLSMYQSYAPLVQQQFDFPEPPGYVVYDPVRDLLYIGQRYRHQIVPLSLATATLGDAIDLPSEPGGFDLTVGNDSLMVALRELHSYAFVDLTSPAHTTTLVADTVHRAEFVATPDQTPDQVRIAANGHAIVVRGSPTHGAHGDVVDVDLTTGTQRQRTDVGVGGQVDSRVQLGRSADRRMLAFGDREGTGQVSTYTSATGMFSALMNASRVNITSIGFDSAGGRLLTALTVFTGGLTPAAVLHPPGAYGPSALTLDGRIALVAVPRGILRMVPLTGMAADETLLNPAPDRVIVVPNHDVIVAITGQELNLVTPPPLSAAVGATAAAAVSTASGALAPLRPVMAWSR